MGIVDLTIFLKKSIFVSEEPKKEGKFIIQIPYLYKRATNSNPSLKSDPKKHRKSQEKEYKRKGKRPPKRFVTLLFPQHRSESLETPYVQIW